MEEEEEVSEELNPLEIEEMNKMLNRETPFSSYQSSLKLSGGFDLKLPEVNRMSPETGYSEVQVQNTNISLPQLVSAESTSISMKENGVIQTWESI